MNQTQNLSVKISSAFEFAQEQVRHLVERYPDLYPMYTQNGRWKHSGESWTHWCDGFLPGMMWIFYAHTGQELWLERALPYTRALEPRKFDRNVHDLGFLFWSTYKRWFDLTGDQALNEVVIQAGQTLGLRFQEKGGYLCSFIGKNSLFIDIMMNVGIIFYAALQTGDIRLLQNAHRHCETTRRCLVRGDGSTAHEGIFNLETGEFLRQSTHQGWRGDSAWARGLAWSLYGFTTAYTLTNDHKYLATAQLCADFFLEHTSFESDAPFGPGIPPNDYDDPRSPALPESSAAAIAASGLLDLAHVVQEQAPQPGLQGVSPDHPGHTDRAALPGAGASELGRHPDAWDLPLEQKPWSGRKRHVGRVFLRRSHGESLKSPGDSMNPRRTVPVRRTGLVTGSSRGIGRAIAIDLARHGWDIVVNYRSDEQSAQETAQAVTQAGTRAVLIQADIGQLEQQPVLLERIREEFGRLDLLVNNAGIGPRQRVDLLKVSPESYDEVMAVNLRGPFFLTQAAANWMLELIQSGAIPGAKIINIGSISAYTASIERAEYCISKAGMGMLTALFAARLADQGIQVYEIRPGIIETDMTQGAKEKYDRLIGEGLTPIRRWGQPEDVACAVTAIAGGALEFSTGEIINVDGGFHLKRL